MKRLIVNWHTKDGNYCGNLAIDYDKRISNDSIKKRIVEGKSHLGKPSNIIIEILK